MTESIADKTAKPNAYIIVILNKLYINIDQKVIHV